METRSAKGFSLIEVMFSLGILTVGWMIAYLDRRYPNPPLFGKNPEEAARVWQQVCETASYIFTGVVIRTSPRTGCLTFTILEM